MIRRTGVQVDDEGKEHYFFEQDLFGIDEPLARVVEYFKAAVWALTWGGVCCSSTARRLREKASSSFCSSAGLRSIRRPMRVRYTRLRTARSTKTPESYAPSPAQGFSGKRVFISRASCARCAPCICANNTRATFIAYPLSASFSRKRTQGHWHVRPFRPEIPGHFGARRQHRPVHRWGLRV